MNLRRPLSTLIVLTGLLAGSCGPVGVTPSASEVGPPSPQSVATGSPATSPAGLPAEAVRTETTTPTLPSPTATPLPLPVMAGTAFPYPEESIRPETAANLRWLSRVGYGSGLYLGDGGLSQVQYGLALSADETRLIVTSNAGIGVFSAQDLSLERFIVVPSGEHAVIAVSRDGTIAAAQTTFLTFTVWDLATGDQIAKYSVPDRGLHSGGSGPDFVDDDVVVLMDISLDNSLLAIAYDSGEIEVLGLPGGELVKRISQYVGTVDVHRIRSLVFEPSGKQLYFLFRDIDIALQSVGFDTTSWAVKSFHFVDSRDFDYTYGVFAPTLSQGTGFRYGYFTDGYSPLMGVYDYQTLGQRFDIPHSAPVSNIGVSSNSQWITTGNASTGQVEVWELENVTGPSLTFPGHANMVWGTIASDDGQTVYSVGWDGVLRKWKAGEQTAEREVNGFYPWISDIAFVPGSDTLLLSSDVGALFELDPRNGVLLRTFPTPYETNDPFPCFLSVSSDGALIAQSCWDPNILPRLWGVAPAVIQRSFESPTLSGGRFPASDDKMALSPDGRWLALTYYTSTPENSDIWLYDAGGQSPPRLLPENHLLESMAFSPDSRLLATAGSIYPVHVFDVATGDLIKEITIVDPFLGEGAIDLAFTADGSLLFVNAGTEIQVYDTSTWTMTSKLPSVGIEDFAVASHSPLLALGTFLVEQRDAAFTVDYRVVLWDYQNNVLFPPVDLPDTGSIIEDMAFSPDGHLLALVGVESVVYILGVEP